MVISEQYTNPIFFFSPVSLFTNNNGLVPTFTLLYFYFITYIISCGEYCDMNKYTSNMYITFHFLLNLSPEL